MRRVLQALMDPVIQQANLDREEFVGFEDRLRLYTEKV